MSLNIINDKTLNLIKELAIKAGNAILEIYESDFAVEMKSDESPLTEADKRANKIIVSALKEKFPDHSILSEESKDDKSRLSNDFCWIIDPLDGTKEFIKKNGEFTVNIALSYKGKPVLGVIYAPVLQDLYYASENLGAKYKNLKNSIEKDLHVSNRTSNFRIAISRSHKSKEIQKLIDKNKYKIEKEIPMGSSLKGCLVAKGVVDMYYRFGYTMEWDTAAMHCIVEKAGALFRQMDDSRMNYNRTENLNSKGFYILNKKENDLR